MIEGTRKGRLSRALSKFDFTEPAEVFGGSSWARQSAKASYRRFGSSAEALRYVIEDLDEAARRSCVIEVNEERFNHIDARKLYASKGYPLPRDKEKSADAT